MSDIIKIIKCTAACFGNIYIFKIPTLGEDGIFIGLLLGHHWKMKMKDQHW